MFLPLLFVLVYQCPHGIFIQYSSLAKESLQFVTKYLATFSNEDSQVLSEAKVEAVRAVIEFVKAPSIFQVIHKAF